MVVYLSDMVSTESSMLLWESATKHQQIPNSKPPSLFKNVDRVVPCFISTLNSPCCLHEEQTLCQKLRRIWANWEKNPQLLNLRASRAAGWDPATKNPPVGVTSQLTVLVSFSCAPEEREDWLRMEPSMLTLFCEQMVVLPPSKLESLEPRHKKTRVVSKGRSIFAFGDLKKTGVSRIAAMYPNPLEKASILPIK